MVDSPRLPGIRGLDLLDRYRGYVRILAASVRPPADLLLHPLIVLPLIVLAVDVPVTVVGVLATAAALAWLVPQLVVDRAGHGPWLLAGQAGTAAALGLTSLLIGGAGLIGPLTVLVAVYWALGGLAAAGGPGGVFGDAEPGDAQRAPLLLGGSLAVLVGLAAGSALGPAGPGFPGWVAQVALVAAVLLALGAGLSWRDRLGPSAGPAPWTALPLATAVLANGRRPRRYVVFRLTLALAALADPLVIVAGLRQFDLTLQAVGVVLALYALIMLAAQLGMPRLVAAGHARLLAQLAALARVLVPVLALSIPAILGSSPVTQRLPADSGWLAPAAWLGLAVLFFLALAATTATDTAYLCQAMAPGHRLAMRALLALTLAVGSLTYLAGGAIAENWGLERLWLVAAAIGLLGMLASGLLMEVPPADTRDETDTGALPVYREHYDSL